MKQAACIEISCDPNVLLLLGLYHFKRAGEGGVSQTSFEEASQARIWEAFSPPEKGRIHYKDYLSAA